ncbi:helix-turn-helix domain-containing protein [Modestobacter sp. SYSU DS0657]
MVTLLDSRQLTGADRRPAAVVGPLAVSRRRGPAHTPPVLSLHVQERGTGRHEQGDRCRAVPPGTLTITDVTSPYESSWGGAEGAGRALQIPVARLGLPLDVVRRAAPHAADSPLYDLVRTHVDRVTRNADRLSADPGWPTLAAATVELARALIVSAAESGATTREVLGDTLLTRIRIWVTQHLTDPDLDAARIAAAHAISVRQLYRLCSAAGFSLEQEVLGQRLEGARAELARPGDRAIAAVARSWGFGDPSHFSRRFRARFGMSPREWRRVSAGADAGHPRPRAGAGNPVQASPGSPSRGT